MADQSTGRGPTVQGLHRKELKDLHLISTNVQGESRHRSPPASHGRVLKKILKKAHVENTIRRPVMQKGIFKNVLQITPIYCSSVL